ncbi:MAG: 50S ribosomal protein L19e [Candidatus Aenigmatarchaeota archaeon]
MDLSTQKEMAADVLDCGKNKVWIDSERQEEVVDAITKADIRRLVQKGIIKEKESNGQSRSRTRKKQAQKKKGRRKGHGRRKGSTKKRKKKWISRIRAQRKLLKELRDNGKIDRSTYRSLYKKSKGGRFDSKKQLKNFIKKEGMLKQGEDLE